MPHLRRLDRCAATSVAPSGALALALALALLAAPARVAGAQQAPRSPPSAPATVAPVVGYGTAAATRERRAEADAIARPMPDSARRHSRNLTRETHVAGTPAQARTRDYVIAEMKRWGLETEVRAYEVWLPHATRVGVWRVMPAMAAGAAPGVAKAATPAATLALDLREGPLAGDSSLGIEYPTANGSTGTGDVTGPLVYVNYGLADDYAALDSVGVSVAGAVVVARYGRSFRGIKAREAEKRGAIALLMYSDPQDDGFVRGDVLPEGPMRPSQGVQRGSVFNGTGDPTTPGVPSIPGVTRIPLSETGLPRIPVAPISHANATLLLRELRGAAIPRAAWQGGLPFRYHTGPGPVSARVLVETDSATKGIKTIWNTFGTIRGTDFPDEIVMVGAHRDAWGPGAADNVSGTVSVLEAARAVAALAKAGIRPRRTMVFATWDAEEWGLVGSTEYVEDDSLRLQRGAVAYLNQDVAAQGPVFGSGGSPSLRATVRDVARLVRDPAGSSVYAGWRTRAGLAPDDSAREPQMGDPGGGSDFAGFYNHLGIPHADWGFGGPAGVYHSAYDSYEFMRRFGDPTFAYHATAAGIGAALMLRIANADVLPYDYVEFARTMQGEADLLARAMTVRKRGDSTGLAALRGAITRMETAARAFAAARDRALAPAAPAVPTATAAATNAALRGVERALTRPEGLRSRPWYRNLVYAADVNNGYSTVVFPSVAEALDGDDGALVTREVADLVTRFDAATRALELATRAVGVSGRR